MLDVTKLLLVFSVSWISSLPEVSAYVPIGTTERLFYDQSAVLELPGGSRSLSLCYCHKRDGRHMKDIQFFLSSAILSWTLMVSPVYAKGGGSGGGHGGGYSHSSSPPSYPSYNRPHRRKSSEYNPVDPWACSNLPVEGELLDVLVDNSRGMYAPGVVTTVNEEFCRFEVEPRGDGRAYFGHAELSSHVNAIDWIIPSFIATFAGSVFLVELAEQRWEDNFDEKFFESDTGEADAALMSMRPVSGFYFGYTSEDDGISQKVENYLQFGDDGSIHGGGKDSEDGLYLVSGAWKEDKVRWTESYIGFEATVRGRIRSRGDIRCRFKSTRGVRGKFKIQKKTRGIKTW